MGRGRRLAAGASLFAAAGGFVWLALENAPSWIEWRSLAFGAALAGASVGLTRKNVTAQIMSRGLAWIVFAPCAVVMVVELMRGRLTEPALTAFGMASGLALFLARPMLNGAEAREQFAPTKFRRSFLAACTATVTTGLVTGMVAWELLWHHQILGGLGLAALGASMLASALGVLRMRGWGIALATVNAILSLVAGALVGDAPGFALAATALPGALFLLPIVLAKLGVGENDARATSRIRVAEEASHSERLRIDVSDEELGLEEPAEQPRIARVA
jgi:hypothetical protein